MRRFAKSDKVADLIRHTVSNALLTGLEDERLRWISVVEVRVSADLSHARIFYSALEPRLSREEAGAALAENLAAVRRYVARHLRLRQVPELRFEFDEAEERARRIETILRDIGREGHDPSGGS